jgi:hypothetical protein
LALALAGPGRAQADEILPADARGIRQLPGQPASLLDFLAVNRSIEDRAVIEFDIRGLAGSVPLTTLNLDLLNLDPGGPVGRIDLFTFAGTGMVTPDLFSVGAFFTSFDNNQSAFELVDVTAAVQAAVNAGEPFLGFRLSTTTSDRFFLGPPFTQIQPTLAVGAPVAEPSTVLLLASGALGLIGWAWRLKDKRLGLYLLRFRTSPERSRAEAVLTTGLP